MLFEGHNTKRAISMLSHFEGLIKPGDRVLDIGLGNGIVAKHVKDHFKTYVEGLDVVDYNETEIKNTIYDGLHLPFKDNSFDCILILQTLHHCTDQIQVLREAKRVAKHHIIIIEDVYGNKFEKLMTFLHDYISNRRKGVKCPYYFQTKKRWKEIFEGIGVKLKMEKGWKSRYLIIRFKHVLFVLAK